MPTANVRRVMWRARRLSDKKLVYGQLLHWDHEGWIYENPTTSWPIDITTKGESIGIQDKNGHDVYEGDLLIATDDMGVYGIYIVVHRGCKFCGKHYNTESYIDLMTHDLEVVGLYYSSELERELQEIKKKLEKLIAQGDNKNASPGI